MFRRGFFWHGKTLYVVGFAGSWRLAMGGESGIAVQTRSARLMKRLNQRDRLRQGQFGCPPQSFDENLYVLRLHGPHYTGRRRARQMRPGSKRRINLHMASEIVASGPALGEARNAGTGMYTQYMRMPSTPLGVLLGL
jgi:hypothetical protein